MPDGLLCKSPALRDRSYCYFHQKLNTNVKTSRRRAQEDQTIDFDSIEDAAGIQIALQNVVEAVSRARIDRRRAGIIVYALHLASSLAKQRANFDPSDVVRDVCETPDGTLIAVDSDEPDSSSH